MSTRSLIQTFDQWRLGGESMVLATVYETVGSTYSKAGHRILIAANGDYQGLVSGGCLEGDLAERARHVLAANEPQAVSFDMRDEADDLWGLGVGCNGLIRIFLQPLTARDGYEPFATLAQHLLTARPAVAATVISSNSGTDGPAAGTTWVWDGRDREADPDADPNSLLVQGCRDAQLSGHAIYRTETDGTAVLYAPVKAIPRLLVLGAGLDAVPVVNMAAELGWRVTVADHRPAYLEKGVFEAAERAQLIDPAAMSQKLQPAQFDAIIVMSHHLLTDQTYLEQLAGVEVGYLGVLGPRERRDRLLKALGESGAQLRSQLMGPVGLDIGADDPESIALSLLAEMHTVLAGASGRALTRAD